MQSEILELIYNLVHMATLKIKFRPSSVNGREGTIYYQITHKRKVRQLNGYKVYSDEWNDKKANVIVPLTKEREAHVVSIRERMRWDYERLTKIIRTLDDKNTLYTTDDIIEEFNRYTKESSLFNFMEQNIIRLKHKGKIRTAETYRATLNNFKKFRNGEDVMLDQISSDMVESYEVWNQNRGITPNTMSFYMRILRAVYNRAVEQEIIDNRSPFRRVYTGVAKTIKRALPLSLIKKIKDLDLTLNPHLDYARDMFMMSFYLRGMSFIDMAFLKKSNLRNGCLTYRRRKTNQQLFIGWTSEMEFIVNKYPENPTDYLLPIIRSFGINERHTYRNVGYNINYNLKKIAQLVGVSIPLTLYVARHSWASAAKAKGIPLSVISEGMGHDSESTTQIYLASLDTSVIDSANSIIISSL